MWSSNCEFAINSAFRSVSDLLIRVLLLLLINNAGFFTVSARGAETTDLLAFGRQAQVEFWPSDLQLLDDIFVKIAVDPDMRELAWRGKVIGFIGKYEKPVATSTGIFEVASNHIIIDRLPPGRFNTTGQIAVLDARVSGLREIPSNTLPNCSGCSFPRPNIIRMAKLDFVAAGPLLSIGQAQELKKVLQEQQRAEQARVTADKNGGIWVTDQVAVLSAEQHRKISTLLQSHNQKGPGRIFLLIVKQLPANTTIERYANDKINESTQAPNVDRILLVIALQNRQLRIETSQEVGEALPDAFCTEVIDRLIVPKFKAQQYYEGIYAGISALIKKLTEY